MAQTEREVDRRIKLTYLQSVQIVEGDRAPEDFIHVGTDYSPLADADLSKKQTRLRERIEDILKTKFGSPESTQTKKDADTGWMITGTGNEVDWSKVAYRLGIRELGLNSFQFATISSIVSTPITSPKPIWKVALKTREYVPEGYDPQTAWILYHVTPDDGSTWYRINPLDKPTRFADDGAIVPRTITFNAETKSADPETQDLVLEDAVRRVRMRYTIIADKKRENANLVSPVIKGVQLMLYPRGGLTGAVSQEAQ